MTTVIYDHAPDTSDSSVIHSAFWNNSDKVLYLVFNNGTISSRRLPTAYQSRHLDVVGSWGSWWNNYLKGLPEAERVENGANFVHREQAPVETPKSNDDGTFGGLGQTVTSIPTYNVITDEMVEAAYRGYDQCEQENSYSASHRDCLRAALEAALVSTPEATPEPETNEDQSFVGIGFFNVPEDAQETLTQAVGFFDEFVQDQIAKIESSIESATNNALREAFKRFTQ